MTLKAAVLVICAYYMKTFKTLLELSKNEEAQIVGFSNKLSQSYMMRLRELGFREGEFVKCLKTPPMGAPRVFQICGSVFSMDTDVAREIELRPSN